jgi:AraC-like DNA-binding protein
MQSGEWHTFFGEDGQTPIQRFRASREPEGRWTHGVQMHHVYEVEAYPGYDFANAAPIRGVFVLARTTAGAGEVALVSGRTEVLAPDTLFLAERAAISRYRCTAPAWRFWWFQFSTSEPLPLRKERAMPLLPAHDDADDLHEVFRKLRRQSVAQRRLAVSLFITLLHRWAVRSESVGAARRGQEALDRVVDLMHAHVRDAWTVKRLAKEAGISHRRMRELFQNLTGTSPKGYYDNVRLAAAFDMLSNVGLSVSETAQRLSYSSPFHFSRAFARHFGYPPSHVSR